MDFFRACTIERKVGGIVMRSVLAWALLVAFLAGCGEKSGVPTTEEPVPDASAGAQSPDHVDFPKVKTILDPERYLKNPCRLIAKKFLSSIGEYGRGEPDLESPIAKDLGGPRCSWYSVEPGGPSVSVMIGTVRREVAADGFKGLEALYRGKSMGQFDHLQPLVIPGHPGNPAVIAGMAEDINSGTCPVTVGLSDDVTLTSMVINQDDPQGACRVAQEVAAAALDTLQGAN